MEGLELPKPISHLSLRFISSLSNTFFITRDVQNLLLGLQPPYSMCISRGEVYTMFCIFAVHVAMMLFSSFCCNNAIGH
jgi:hypothetical protein